MSRRSQRSAVLAAEASRAGPSAPTRPKRGAPNVKKEADGMDADAVAELWAQFAADHYEIVEQLPLELHRNSRLLRELDSESLSQQTRLQAKIREYIAYRLAVATPQAAAVDEEVVDAVDGVDEAAPSTDHAGPSVDAEAAFSAEPAPPPPVDVPPFDAEPQAPAQREAPDELTAIANRREPPDVKPEVSPDVRSAPHEAPPTDAPSTSAATALITRPADGDPTLVPAPVHIEEDHDAEAAVELALDAGSAPPPERAAAELQTPLLASPPPRNGSRALSRARSQISYASHAHSSAAPEAPGPYPKRVNLADISSLISELVRNREEKVAIAVGAYNTIDRHIRALDSALSAQETSVLGFAPAPSAEPQPTPQPQAEANPKDKRKKGRGSTSKAPSEPVVPNPATGLPPGIEADPNEPRYCYCNQVSYGEMVGCDNDDCPMEWFHLACLGMTAPPVGDWMCEPCTKEKEKLGGASTAPLKKRRKR